MDTLTREHRSWLMSQIKGKNTKPEIKVRQLIYALGYRYRLHGKQLPGCPDIVFFGKKKVIFVNGCYWHGHLNCRYAALPKTNIEFWSDKIAKNKERDHRNVAALESEGWKVAVIWQCEIRSPELLVEKIKNFLSNNKY
ncbi:very short patch repair endonuclease [Pseudomonas sp. GM60]|jgi:DNA mismatch endonuclease (patch repair protein)|uniref:very short patch repair endonuclease n=1 Tax=Pseudomonas sp. GM60 TaxID=1144334 RepID=UPI0009DB34BE|nr:very short patch repair endonuclease [Pseudomonas sp. GM60]